MAVPITTIRHRAELADQRVPVNILVVDDEPKNLFAAAQILGELGENVVTAASGKEALRHLLSQDFAVILLDVRMPELDGYETAALIRSREKTKHVPIIFLSAVNREDDDVLRGYALGAVDYVFKPIKPVILKSKIAVFVDLYKKNEEVRRQAEAERLLQVENLRVRAEKAEAERALRRVEERQTLIIRSLPIALYTARSDGSFAGPRFLGEQFRELLGFAAERFVDDPDLWVGQIHAADRPRVLEELASLPETGSHTTEYRWQCADGTERYFLDQAVLIRGESGEPQEIFGTCLDVTERKHIEQQLVHAQKMEALGQLTGGIAHDFNNMLTVVIGHLDMLGRSLKDRGKDHDRVQMALTGARNCADLTKRLLAFASRQPLQPAPIDLKEMLPSVSRLLRQSLGEMIEVTVDVAADIGSAVADPGQVESAVMNLAINARDAMPNGGRLLIEAANAHLEEDSAAESANAGAGDYVMLAVTDTGTGMPPEVLARALDPFFTTKQPGQGTGLGLSMVYGFVRQSGGRLDIESKVGHGTTIRMYLPRTDVPAATCAAARASESETDIGPTGRVILVAEDDENVRAVTVAHLTELGCRVLEAHDGRAALQMFERGEPVDLLLTDVVMPGGMTGIDLAREATKRQPDLKVLYTSGYSTSFSGPDAPAGILLQKPYRNEDLRRALRRALDQHG